MKYKIFLKSFKNIYEAIIKEYHVFLLEVGVPYYHYYYLVITKNIIALLLVIINNDLKVISNNLTQN